jgi:hypothetical protein
VPCAPGWDPKWPGKGPRPQPRTLRVSGYALWVHGLHPSVLAERPMGFGTSCVSATKAFGGVGSTRLTARLTGLRL